MGRTQKFCKDLINWFERHKRALPWRIMPTPYRVWVSEVMLQQTQAATAEPYFIRFVERFPDLESLARAPEQEVLSFWSGLGYYSRARNLHLAAGRILKHHNGIFPDDFNAILALPGIGRYTAGAICSLAYNQPRPIVDGNIRRVIVRLNAIRKRTLESYFWNQMKAWIPEGKASAFNQAMMELGALICTPFRPHCLECPVQSFCESFKCNIQKSLPRPSPGRPPEKFEMVILILLRGDKVLLTNEMPDFIPGRWGLPSQLVSGNSTAGNMARRLSRRILGEAVPLLNCAGISHSISYRRITAHLFTGEACGSTRMTGKSRWYARSSSGRMLTSSLFIKALAYSEKAAGGR